MRRIARLWLCLGASLGIGVAGQSNGAGIIRGLRLRSSIPEIRNSRQLIVVTTEGWSKTIATVRLFERSAAGGTPWSRSGKAFPAVVGASGCGWGIGLHGTGGPETPRKREGDRRAPAGVFKLYAVFGLAPAGQVRFLRFPYRQVISTTEAVDDPRSRYYNRIVNRDVISRPDWSRSESMQRVGGRYRFGVMIEHNWGQVPGFGSCIFLHIWAGPTRGTSGCTAMSATDLDRLLHWLDVEDNPLMAQMPLTEYRKLAGRWDLPMLED
jgi:D-alanyl-D-alanine dipeptidase